jgi:hypothetical protein
LKGGDESNGKNEQDRHIIILVDKVEIKIFPMSLIWKLVCGMEDNHS